MTERKIQTDKETDRQRDRQTKRQTDKETKKEKTIETKWYERERKRIKEKFL